VNLRTTCWILHKTLSLQSTRRRYPLRQIGGRSTRCRSRDVPRSSQTRRILRLSRPHAHQQPASRENREHAFGNLFTRLDRSRNLSGSRSAKSTSVTACASHKVRLSVRTHTGVAFGFPEWNGITRHSRYWSLCVGCVLRVFTTAARSSRFASPLARLASTLPSTLAHSSDSEITIRNALDDFLMNVPASCLSHLQRVMHSYKILAGPTSVSSG
jgi:hypothetical protein